MTWANFSFYMSSSKEKKMARISQFFLIRWLVNVYKDHKIRQERKRTAYFEKRWEDKLRGLR